MIDVAVNWKPYFYSKMMLWKFRKHDDVLNDDITDDITRVISVKFSTIHSNLLVIHYDVTSTCRFFLQNKHNANKEILNTVHPC